MRGSPPNWADTDADGMHPLVSVAAGGAVLVDVGDRDHALLSGLQTDWGVVLLNPAQADTKRAFISSLRERIQTPFSGLWHRFVDGVFSRSWIGLWSTIQLKLLHFDLCQAGILSC